MKANDKGKVKTITKANGGLALLMVGLDTLCTKSVISILTILSNFTDASQSFYIFY